MKLLLAVAAVAPALLDSRGGRFELEAHALWPVAALIDATGAVRGALHVSEEIVRGGQWLGFPRLDVFDSSGRRRIIVRRDGPLPMLVFLDAQERPRLRLDPGRAQLLDAGGKPAAYAEGRRSQPLTILAGDRVVAVAEQDGEGASVALGPAGEPSAVLEVSESGWKLTVGGGRLALVDPLHQPDAGVRRPAIGPLQGLAEPEKSRYHFAGPDDPPRPTPVLPWVSAPLDFDAGGPTTALADRGEQGPVLHLQNAR